MKTVSGKVVSTAPISLSKAATVLANFSSFDNGASPTVSVYLNRASAAFDALVQFHKQLKSKHHPIEDNNHRPAIKSESEQNPSRFVEDGKRGRGGKEDRNEELDVGRVKIEKREEDEKEARGENGLKKRDKKKRKKREGEERPLVEKGEKKMIKIESYDEEGIDSEEQSSKKKRKKRKVEGKN